MAAIDEAILGLMADVDHIAKEHKNTQQGFMFRGIDDVYNAIHPLLGKHGVYMTCEVLAIEYSERQTQKGGTMFQARGKYKYTLRARDGSSVSTEALGEAMDSGDKAASKSMAIAHKYALIQLLCIPTEEIQDPDSSTPAATKPVGASKDPKAAFGAGAKPPPPKFDWRTATSAQRKDYTIQRLQLARANPDPVKAAAEIEKIMAGIGVRLADITPADQDLISAEVIKLKQDIQAECAGQ
jgi:hypothetical protein